MCLLWYAQTQAHCFSLKKVTYDDSCSMAAAQLAAVL